jgi:hypothetical protein
LNFYKLRINHNKGGFYFVYYRSINQIPLQDVVLYAIMDGDLGEHEKGSVDEVTEITEEEYFTKMWC